MSDTIDKGFYESAAGVRNAKLRVMSHLSSPFRQGLPTHGSPRSHGWQPAKVRLTSFPRIISRNALFTEITVALECEAVLRVLNIAARAANH